MQIFNKPHFWGRLKGRQREQSDSDNFKENQKKIEYVEGER